MDQSLFCTRLPLYSHLLQQCLRSLCLKESPWLYAVFWRVLPRNFPPPKWEIGGYLDRSKANKRNWILVWEDGFCDFARGSSGLQPDLFFKMSHEVYNYGEGLMGKVSADNGHKWVLRDPVKSENDKANVTSSWQSSIDLQPRTWEPQFKSGIQTITVISVHEGLVQLGSTESVPEDLNFVVHLRQRFSNLQITHFNGAILSSPPSPTAKVFSSPNTPPSRQRSSVEAGWHDSPIAKRTLARGLSWNGSTFEDATTHQENHIHHLHHHGGPPPSSSPSSSVMPSMSSLQALLSKLPSVGGGLTNGSMVAPNLHNNHVQSLADTSHSSSPLIRSLSVPYGADYGAAMPNAFNTSTLRPTTAVTSACTSPSKAGTTVSQCVSDVPMSVPSDHEQTVSLAFDSPPHLQDGSYAIGNGELTFLSHDLMG